MISFIMILTDYLLILTDFSFIKVFIFSNSTSIIVQNAILIIQEDIICTAFYSSYLYQQFHFIYWFWISFLFYQMTNLMSFSQLLTNLQKNNINIRKNYMNYKAINKKATWISSHCRLKIIQNSHIKSEQEIHVSILKNFI